MAVSIRILSKAEKNDFPDLFDQMFQGRAEVFRERLQWDVDVIDGKEIDRYDLAEDPIYLLAIDERDRVRGSLRLLPTTGATMLRSEFRNFFDDDVDVAAPTIWECTRFCVPPSGQDSIQGVKQTSTELLIALCDLCLSSGIEFIVGVYNKTMIRIYQRIGWTPEPLADARPEFGDISVGVWEATPAALSQMQDRLAMRISEHETLVA